MKSINNEWSTPQDLYDLLNDEFRFNLDACASHWNRKCTEYYCEEISALSGDWPVNSVVWMNPPYGSFTGKFIKHAYKQSQERSCIVVYLIPTNTEAKWFHDCCLNGELRFVQGRIHFSDKDGKSGRPRFSSVVGIFRPNNEGRGVVSALKGYRGGK